jgi:dTDP-4-dehydrorhamnose 3,5-epimerase
VALLDHTAFDGIEILDKNIYTSDLGYFSTIFDSASLKSIFIQDSVSKSIKTGTVRGLHFQKSQHAQAKLINVIEGSIVDFFVDLRKDSSTFLSYGRIELNHETTKSLFIPRGFAHGFITRMPNTIINYKLDNLYNPASEETLLWNDPDVGIIWPEMKTYHLSPKDLKGKNLDVVLKEIL